jgi:hypothetical protein
MKVHYDYEKDTMTDSYTLQLGNCYSKFNVPHNCSHKDFAECLEMTLNKLLERVLIS